MSKRRIWLISDWHFWHRNMLRGGKIASRPFDSLEQMHEEIITRHNSVVAPDDDVICLGDVTLERNPNAEALRIVTQLLGNKRLLLGNHDHYDPEQYRAIAGFTKIQATHTVAGYVLSHIPLHPAQFGRFRGNIHGHTHDNMVQRYQFDIDHTECRPSTESACCDAGVVAHISQDPRYLNVCVEPLGYTPILLDEAITRMENRLT